MDSLHAIGFYVSSGVSVAAALGFALLPARGQRGAAMGVLGLGLAGVYLTLSAGFAAGVALVCYLTCAVMFASPQYRSLLGVAAGAWRQVGAVGAALLLAALLYSALRGDFAHASFYGGLFGGASLGRLLFEHDAAAVEALALLVLVALAGAGAAWRGRERSR